MQCRESYDGPDWQCPSCGFKPRRVDGVTCFSQAPDNNSFDPKAFERLAELERASFWFRSRNRLISWALAGYFPHACSLLEVGCGTGFVLEGMRQSRPNFALAGGELHAEGLSYARRIPDVDFFQFDARRIPFDREFDVVGAFDVLEHIEEDQCVLAEMRTAVKPDGGIILTVPQHPWLWGTIDEYAKHKRRYRRSELLDKVSNAGFAIRRVTSFVSLLLPAMAAARFNERVRRRPLDPAREHLAAQRGTGPLERVMDLERALVSRGLDLPAGGSLLIVAARV